MRGHDEQSTHMFSYLSPEQRVPADHPLRAVRALTDEALRTMSRRFAGLYANTGRPSIPPEQLLRALLLQVLYTVRSERLLMEELNYNLLFRWFVGLNLDDPVWHPTTFTKNRDRLLAGDIAAAFFDAVQAHARAAGLLSDEHFTVDGTQLEAWASLKSFRCRDAAESDPPDDPGNPAISEFPKWRKYLISLSFRGQSSVRPVQVGGFDVNIVIHRSTAVRGCGGPARHDAWPPSLGAILAHRAFPIKSPTKNTERPQNSVGKPG